MTASGLPDAVRTLIEEAEAASTRIADLRRTLQTAENTRRKLLIAIDAAIHAVPPGDRGILARSLTRLADSLRPARGRPADSRCQAIVERLAMLGQKGETIVRVSEMTSYLDRIGFANLSHGSAPEAMARLAGQGFLVQTGTGRCRMPRWPASPPMTVPSPGPPAAEGSQDPDSKGYTVPDRRSGTMRPAAPRHRRHPP